MADFNIIVGGIYQHTEKGNNYKVLVISNQHATDDRREEFPIMVTYQDLDSGLFWSRKIEKFKERVKPNDNYGQGGIM